MDNRLQATFMPRQPATPGGAYPGQRGQKSFFMTISVILFLLVIVAMGGLIAYKSFLKGSNTDKQGQIEEAIKNFEPELTKELTIIKNRMDAGKNLLDSHRAVSLFFSLLELNTVQVLRFTEVSYSVSPDKKIMISMKGEARSYNAIAFQSDVFSKVEQLKNPIFSNLNLDDEGIITFDFDAEIDSNATLYKNLISGLPIPTVPASMNATSTATTTPSTSTTTPANRGTRTPGRVSTSTPPRT